MKYLSVQTEEKGQLAKFIGFDMLLRQTGDVILRVVLRARLAAHVQILLPVTEVGRRLNCVELISFNITNTEY